MDNQMCYLCDLTACVNCLDCGIAEETKFVSTVMGSSIGDKIVKHTELKRALEPLTQQAASNG